MKLFKHRGVFATLILGSLIPLTFAGVAPAAQAPVPLGDAASFGALSFTAMTNQGLDTVVSGNLGSSTSIDVGVTNPGFARYLPPSVELANAQASLLLAYNNAEAQMPTGDITGDNLAGETLLAGVYNSTGAILISGPAALTLNGQGNADAVFIFQAAAAGDLTVNGNATVTYINGAQPCNVFWKVRSALLSNTGFTFVGTILALSQITLTDNITLQGRALARNADVTFIHDVVTRPSTCIQQADVDSAAAQAAAAAAASEAAAKAADDAADAARDAAAAAQAAETARAAAAAQAAVVAAETARVEADKAAAAKVAAEQAAAAAATAARVANAARVARAVQAAKVAAAKAKAASAAAVKAAAKAKLALAKTKKAAAGSSTSVQGPALPPVNPSGFTG
jgi:hypothetical protein